jgi:hypothetical protein
MERAIHFPFSRICGVDPDKLRVFLRSDRIAQFGVRYFMGMEGYTLDKYLALIEKYSAQAQGEPDGGLIIVADDAEYIGTNGWFRLKYQNQPDNVFEATPESRQKLIDLITAVQQMGEFMTFDQACRTLPALCDELSFDDDSAWHGAKASTWAGTPMARLLRPRQDLVRAKLNDPHSGLDDRPDPGSTSRIPTTPMASGRPLCPTRLISSIPSTMPIVSTICSRRKCWLAASIMMSFKLIRSRSWKKFWPLSRD